MEAIDIICQDGVLLKGHFLPAHAGIAPPTKQPVLLCPATGVKQSFYFPFATWLADHGHDVLVFDYRGVGLSLVGPLQHNRATLAEWGQQDQVAAVQWLANRTESKEVMLVGHSAGDQMIGLLPNHARVSRVVGVAASTGWLQGMRPAYRIKAFLGLCCMVPVATFLKGYSPTSLLGLGEDLPAAVGRQWARWCAAGGYATNAVRNQPHADFHSKIRIPITVLHASDDEIANALTVSDLLRTFPEAQKKVFRIVPEDHGLKSIGHINWFSRSHMTLWPLVAQALNEAA